MAALRPATRGRFHLVRHLPTLAFLVPAVLLFATFSWYPILRGFALSLMRWSGQGVTFVGLENFHFVLSDPLFARAWRNTAAFVALGILFGYLVPVAIALAMNELRHGQTFFRAAFYLPAVLPGVVVVMLWKWIYDPAVGILNSFLRSLHLPTSMWFQSPQMVLPSLVLMSIWAYSGSTALIYLAALQDVPPQLYEAAEVDGAGPWHKLWHIALPHLRRVMLMVLILQVIGTTQVFTEPYVMTGGGPNNTSLTVMILIFRYAFEYYNLGAAAAAGLVLFAALVSLSLAYFWLTRRLDASAGD